MKVLPYSELQNHCQLLPCAHHQSGVLSAMISPLPWWTTMHPYLTGSNHMCFVYKLSKLTWNLLKFQPSMGSSLEMEKRRSNCDCERNIQQTDMVCKKRTECKLTCHCCAVWSGSKLLDCLVSLAKSNKSKIILIICLQWTFLPPWVANAF